MKLLSDRLRIPNLLPSPGYAPRYISHLRSIVSKAAKHGVVLYARISDPRPGNRETCTDQLRAIQTEIRRLEQEFGIKVTVHDEEFAEAVSGWKLSRSERPELVKAAKLAKKKGAVLVAFDVSRFVRHEGALPTDDDFDQLMRLVGNAKLATIASPDIHEDRSRSTKRGHKSKNAKPGRPKKCSYRAPFNRMPKKFARVVRLRYSGMSWGEIAKEVGRAKSTVRSWYERGANFSTNDQ